MSETFTFEIIETMAYQLELNMPTGSTEADAVNKASEIWDGLSASEIFGHSTGLIDQEFRKVEKRSRQRPRVLEQRKDQASW